MAYSPEVQAARDVIYAWSLVKKKCYGQKISSRLVLRTIKKAKIDPSVRHLGQDAILEQLSLAHKHYYELKKRSPELRLTAMEKLAAAIAEEGNIDKAKAFRSLREREAQRTTAKKIRFLQGKVASGE